MSVGGDAKILGLEGTDLDGGKEYPLMGVGFGSPIPPYWTVLKNKYDLRKEDEMRMNPKIKTIQKIKMT